ncbi:hypothetical protein BTVI_142539 [Pitangus sulphuratus]|nr:hypothetical protein BTVI_142539 [Pitangus sulphuratus]
MGSRVVISNMKSIWRPGTNGIPQRLLRCLVLLNIFIPDLSNGTLSSCADDTNLEERLMDQRIVLPFRNKLEKRADRNIVTFKVPSFAPGFVALLVPVYAGANGVESCFAEKDLKFLVDKLNMRQQCVPMAENSRQLPELQRKVTLPFYAVLMKPPLDNCAQFCCIFR